MTGFADAAEPSLRDRSAMDGAGKAGMQMNSLTIRDISMQPHDYPRRILLAVTGLSPQVVTETLYALAVTQHPPFVPTEVHLITTAQGADHARLNLLSDDPGWFHRLCRDYGLTGIRFDAECIHVLRDTEGNPLSDIRTPAENERAADLITETVRDLTADEQAAVHVSIAGGRKTMGFYLGYALSLYGRPQDRLSHVLVSAPFESHPQFYYPTPHERVIHTLDRAQIALDCRTAEVALASIPFVSLRHGLPPENLLKGHASFSETVAAARRALGPYELFIDPRRRGVRASGVEVKLPPADLAFYSLFARRRLENKAPLPCPAEGAPEPEYAALFLAEYRAILGPMGDDDRTAAALAPGMSKDYFLERKSSVNKKLKATLGYSAGPYLIQGKGKRPRTGFELGIEASSVHIG